MSKISISVAEPILNENQASKLVFSLSRCLGLSLADVKMKLNSGRNDYLYRTELYLNNHVEVDKEIRELLSILKHYKVAPYILEILYNENWDKPIDLKTSLISAEDLIGILDSSKGEYE